MHVPAGKFNPHFYRAGHIQGFHAESILPMTMTSGSGISWPSATAGHAVVGAASHKHPTRQVALKGREITIRLTGVIHAFYLEPFQGSSQGDTVPRVEIR
jgi:hypothetical protein